MIPFQEEPISMKTVDYIKMGLETSRSLITGLLDDMKDAPLTAPTSKGGNHPLWILGHLTFSEANIIYCYVEGKPNPLESWQETFAGGSDPVADPQAYPSWDEVRAKWDEVTAHTMEVLATLSDDDLDRPSHNCPPERQDFFGTIGQCFLVATMHRTMHFGQVADARRMAGRPPLFV